MVAKDENGPDQDGSGGGEASGAAARIPPYIAFQTLLTFFKELKTNGLPPQIDKSVLRRFSGGLQGQLKMAIRSLGLVEGDKPTPRLASIIDAFETPNFEPLLLDVLKETYPYVFALDLMNATPTMFADSFKATGAKEDVSRKCRTFFLHAAKRAGVPLGTRILTGSVPRSPSNGSGRKKAKIKTREESAEIGPPKVGSGDHAHPHHHKTMASQLLEKFPAFDPTWSPEIQAKWFEGYQRLLAMGEK